MEGGCERASEALGDGRKDARVAVGTWNSESEVAVVDVVQ